MKKKQTRICARKGCEREFKMYKTTDKYCCLSCKLADERAKAAKPKPKRVKIDQYSAKRKKESQIYTKKRRTFFEHLEDHRCPVCLEIFGEERPATEVHHKAGRTGKLLNYVPYWLAVSEKGHKYIHAHPEESYKRGWMILRTTVDARLLKKN